MQITRRTVAMFALVALTLTWSAPEPALGSPKFPVAKKVYEDAKALLDAFWHLSQDTDKDTEEMAAAWATVSNGIVAWSNLALRLAEENDALKESSRREISMPPDPGSGVRLSASDWLRIHAPYLQAVAGPAGMRLARWRGTMCANASDLEKMLLAAPLYIHGYHALLEAIDQRLDDASVLLGSANTLVEIKSAQYDLRVTRVMTANAQTALRRQRAAIEGFMLDAAPDPLDVEAGEVIKPFMSAEFHEGVLPEFKFYSESFVQHVEEGMQGYEDAFEKAEKALLPLLDGSAFDDIPIYKDKGLSQYMKPVELIEEFAKERRKAVAESTNLASEIAGLRDAYRASSSARIEDFRALTPTFYEIDETLNDLKPQSQGEGEVARRIRRIGEDLRDLGWHRIATHINALSKAQRGLDGESFDKLKTDLQGARTEEALSDIRARRERLDFLLDNQLRESREVYELLEYQSKVLRERIEEVVKDQRNAVATGTSLKREIAAGWDEFKTSSKALIEDFKALKRMYEKTDAMLRDLEPRSKGEGEVARRIRKIAEDLRDLDTDQIAAHDGALKEAWGGLDGESFKKLETDLQGARTDEAVRDIRERYERLRSRLAKDVSERRKAYERLKSQSKALRERIESLPP